MTDGAPFRTRTVWWLIFVGALSFAGAAVFTVLNDRVQSAEANTFSVSAIGHRALVETLERLDIPVIVSRFRSAEKAGPASVLIVAEPDDRVFADADNHRLFDAPNVLYVLPKRQGVPADDRRDWLQSVNWVPTANVDDALRMVDPGGRVAPRTGTVGWYPNRFGLDPEIDDPQLIVAGSVTPIVAGDGGILAGEILRGASRILVLSDPDILANHGLARGQNAALAVALIEHLRAPGGVVIFDETHHGFIQRPSLWRSAVRLPFAIVSIQVLVAIAVLIWAAAGRFGAPLPMPRPFRSGKAALIDNAVNLLGTGGVEGEVFVRYIATVQSDVADRLHAPGGLDARESVAWLDRIGRARGIGESLGSLVREAEDAMQRTRGDDARLLGIARRFNRWRQEMIDGPRRDRDHRAEA